MSSGFLTKKDRKSLLDAFNSEAYKKYADRIRVILLLDQGETLKNISKFLFLNEGSVVNYKKRYKKGGLKELIVDDYLCKKSFLNKKQLGILYKDLKKNHFSSSKKVIAHIEEKFAFSYSKSGVKALFHRLNFSYKKATGVPSKAKKKEQEKFLKEYKEIKETVKEEGGLIFYADSTHPEHNTHLTYAWIPKGETFEVPTVSGMRKRMNVCGMIERETLETVIRTHKTVNHSSIREMLKLIRKKHSDEKSIFIVLDGASYHRSVHVKELAERLGIKLVYLPAYSPNLNPIERLWKFMKKEVLANKHYENYDDFKFNISSFFRGIRKYKPELQTLITDNFSVMGT